MSPHALVVDDNEAIRRLVHKLLERDGIVVTEAVDGVEAVSRIQSETFDVILLDLMMPRAGGFDVIEDLARTRPDVLNKVIVMTAAAGLVKHESLRRVHSTVTKPFTITDLLSAVRACIASTRRAGIAASGS
ncbi:MAG: response regulator [Thermoanaerobaculia bacterium]